MRDRLQDINVRPSFIYVNIISETVSKIRKLLESVSAEANIRPVADALDSLSHTLQEPGENPKKGVIPALREYESAREMPIGENKRARLNELASNIKIHEGEIDKIAKDHDEKLQKLNRERDSLVKNSNAEVWEKIISSTDRINKKREKLLELDEQRKGFETRIEQIEQGASCGCVCCLSKADKKLRDKNQTELNKVNSSITALADASKISDEELKKGDEAKERLSQFQKSLHDKDEKIEGEISKGKIRDKHAREKYQKAKDAHANLYEEIILEGLGFCKNLDRDTMFDMVHLRAKVDHFLAVLQQAIESMDKSSSNKKLKEQRGVLDAIQGKLLNFTDVLNKKLEGMYCENSGNNTGLRLYHNYFRLLKFKPEIKKQFEEPDYSPNTLIDIIIPEKKASVLNLKLSGKNNVDTFFPTVSNSSDSDSDSEKEVITSVSSPT